MERLTSWNEDCVLINGHALGYATKCELVQMAERLAAYEDSRLSPQACAQAAEIEKQLASYDFSAKKMLEFIRADKAGRCVVLQCKVGDTVWFKTYKNSARDCIGIQPHEITRISISVIVPGEIVDIGIPVDQIGKSVFLSKEEANEADAKPPAENAILSV